MARPPSKHLRQPRPLPDSLGQAQSKVDGPWVVQALSAGRTDKEYLCPGCNQRIAAGSPQIVAWPSTAHVGSSSPVAERRHWHTPCWNRRR